MSSNSAQVSGLQSAAGNSGPGYLSQMEKTSPNQISLSMSSDEFFSSSYYKEILWFFFSITSFAPLPSSLKAEFAEMAKFLQDKPSLLQMFQLVIDNLLTHRYTESIFFAEKLQLLTENNPIAVFLLGEALFLNGDFKKVTQVIRKAQRSTFNASFQLLAAMAYLKIHQYDQCLKELEAPVYCEMKQEAHRLLLRANCFEAQENKSSAVACYIDCLKKDPTCTEALNKLTDRFLLSSVEREQILSNLVFPADCSWMRFYFQAKAKDECIFEAEKPLVTGNSGIGGFGPQISFGAKTEIEEEIPLSQQSSGGLFTKKQVTVSGFGAPRRILNQGMNKENDMKTLLGFGSRPIPSSGASPSLTGTGFLRKPEDEGYGIFMTLLKKQNLDFLVIKAKSYQLKYQIANSLELCEKILEEDPLYFEIVPIYCACLVEKRDLATLYSAAHNFVENYPNQASSWFAVGAYYFAAKKHEAARKYFQKATTMDRNFVYSWISFGHSFACQDESDQAMSVYRTVARLFPGCHLSHLYIGMEYLRTNNLKTAELSLQQARELQPYDPLVFNELGTIYFKKKQYSVAKEYFLSALGLCGPDAVSWLQETILTNLGHCYRKTRDYKSASVYFEKCLNLNAKSAQNFFNLAFNYHLQGNFVRALECYHKSLFLKADNSFAQDMLNKCLLDTSDHSTELLNV